MWNRAAQFAPFAALTGYEAAIQNAKEKTQESFGQTDNEESY